MELSGMQALIALLVLVAGPGGAAWVAVKVSLNGTRQDVRDIKEAAGRMERKLTTTSENVAVLNERSADHDRRISWLEDHAA